MSKKEELQAELERLDNLKRSVQEKLDEIIEAERHKIGYVCKFWNEDENDFVISKLKKINVVNGSYYTSTKFDYYLNAKPVSPQQVQELLFGKERKDDN